MVFSCPSGGLQTTRRLPARPTHRPPHRHTHSPAVAPPQPRQPHARAPPRPRDPSILHATSRCFFYAPPNPPPAQRQQSHCDPSQSQRNHSHNTLHHTTPEISLPCVQQPCGTPNPRPQPRSRAPPRPRDPIFALASPPRSLSQNPVTHSATSPTRPRLRAPNPSQTSAFSNAHRLHTPKHYFAHSAPPHLSALAPPQNPVGPLMPPGPPRGRPRPTQKCRKSPCGHNGPLCGLGGQNARSQGRAQGRASGWPRWDPLPLLPSSAEVRHPPSCRRPFYWLADEGHPLL